MRPARFVMGLVILMAPVAGVAPPLSAQAPGFVGSEVCSACHQPQHERFALTGMGRRLLHEPRSELERQGCESCHGPGSGHVAAGGRAVPGFVTFARNDRTPIEQRNRVCLQCHEGSARLQWMGSTHDGGNVACTNCHSVMAPQSETAQLRFATALQTCGQCHRRQERAARANLSRMPLAEGAMTCPSCHNPHGSPNERMLVGASVNETCYGCHAEKRGPFLWEHAPVAENCANCHDPHGGRNEVMLNRPRPRLCQQCHMETRHPGTPYRSEDNNSRVVNRACNNCHTQIHGSNHPGGNRYIR